MHMNNFVPLKTLRENFSKYTSRVEKGDSFIVMKRSQPLFRMSPVEEEGWETVIDFTKFRKGGIPASELLKILETL